MTKVTEPFAAAPQLMKQWMAVSLAVQDSLEKSLTELVKIRAWHTQGEAKAALEAEFTPEEQVKLTLMINIINGWNRIAVGFDLWLEQPARAA